MGIEPIKMFVPSDLVKQRRFMLGICDWPCHNPLDSNTGRVATTSPFAIWYREKFIKKERISIKFDFLIVLKTIA
jgi:hypothetical protein